MLAIFGLQHASNDLILAVLAFAAVTSILCGWATDAVLGEAGFGVIGNAILSFLGGFIGCWFWAAFLRTGPVLGLDFISLSMFGAAGAMTVLIMVAAVCKVATD
jgi:uncharacterized membrane protein YeaQ/YmgE (transglycosylase-associated protein family)